LSSFDSRQLALEIPRLRRYARALVGDRAAADDLLQDTLERAWSRAGQWRPGSDLRVWLFSIMHNLRIDELRCPRIVNDPIDDDFVEPPVRPTQADGLEVLALDAALRLLPEEQREVLLLVSLEDMGYEQAAAALGIPVGTVTSRLARGRERLRHILNGGAPVVKLRVQK
jgi:RNA polymerase sigma factor (sigma-70 family)